MNRRRYKRKIHRLLNQPIIKRSEQLLIHHIAELSCRLCLCRSLGGGQFAASMAREWTSAEVVCHYLDIFPAERAREMFAGELPNLSIVCETDPPEQPYDLVAFPFQASGDAELTRDLMQSGHMLLESGGEMVVSTENSKDTWLHQEMQKLFDKVTRIPSGRGVVYRARKTHPLKKVKNFKAEFAFRDGEQLIRVVSRPGVFSHRKIDGGARALMNRMEVAAGQRVLDIGCGSGAVALAAAFRAPDVHVLAVDSNPRAVQCTRDGAALNGLSNVDVLLNADVSCDEPASYDWALANPPYFSNYQIAEVFLQGAQRALKPGGRVLVVTKNATWYTERMPDLFDEVTVSEQKEYLIVSGTARGGKSGRRKPRTPK